MMKQNVHIRLTDYYVANTDIYMFNCTCIKSK